MDLKELNPLQFDTTKKQWEMFYKTEGGCSTAATTATRVCVPVRRNRLKRITGCGEAGVQSAWLAEISAMGTDYELW